MAFTTWNPADKSANITLSNGNKTAATATGAQALCRSVDKQIGGKCYWECTFDNIGGSQTAVGVCDGSADMNTFLVSQSGNTAVFSGGQVFINGVQVGGSFNLGTISNGSVICIAVDFTAKQIWFRIGAAGTWNGRGDDPVAGLGGFAISVGGAVSGYAVVSLYQSPAQVTANFGASAFVGAVPTGFTSGFTAGVSAPTNLIATEVMIEEWASGGVAAIVTSAMIEEWAWNPATSGAGGGRAQARVAVMA